VLLCRLLEVPSCLSLLLCEDSLASKVAILGVQIPSHFLLMAPYIATMIVLAGVVGRGQMPAADGQPYEKE
jgi:simple sugar transport system permease protein